MSKKLFIVVTTLFLIFALSSGVSAQISGFYGLDSMLMSDWQLDYIRPLEPGDLKKGDYRLSPIIVNIASDRERNAFDNRYNNYDYDYGNTTTAYILVFDTALSDNLTLHSKFAYQPWEKYSYDDYHNIDESRTSLFDLFINYEFKEDKQMFFGYNRILEKDKEYDNIGNLEYEGEDTNNIYYLGFELRGSFLTKNK